MGFFGSSGGRRKNTLASRVRRAESRANKLIRKQELQNRLDKANTIIRNNGKKRKS